MPPVLADEMEKEELNLIKVSLMDYVNTAALEFISGKRDLDADWDANVKDCEGKGNQELSFLVPEEEGKGVRRIAVKVAKDVEKTLGMHAASGEMPDIHLMKKRF